MNPQDLPVFLPARAVQMVLFAVDIKTLPLCNWISLPFIFQISFARYRVDDQEGVQILPFRKLGMERLKITYLLRIELGGPCRTAGCEYHPDGVFTPGVGAALQNLCVLSHNVTTTFCYF